MKKSSLIISSFFFGVLLPGIFATAHGQSGKRVLGFFTAKQDLAHISFVHEANKWFDSVARKNNFRYDSTSDWTRLNAVTPDREQLIVFLDTRPEDSLQRVSFERYMKAGGAWMGFHFSAFALNQSGVPNNWSWYHDEFIGAGEYKGNTWHPTSAILKVEDRRHPAVKGLPATIKTAPNEWYSWKNDLRINPAIRILLSVDSSSFPLGNGPKLYEIWHSGYYPVVWTNVRYKMIYFNMGHNDMDYDNKTNRQLSSTFSSPMENKLIIHSMLWLLARKS